ncbi:MAG TPA: AAA family ATPase [Thermoanaerobaculia bacterium]|jgi:transcriptional regulator with XRE-family HTH domain/Zn-dependent peptidase ImmA (M78 family)
MIKNERQYRITKAQAERFREAIRALQSSPPDEKVHPILRRAELEALQSQLADLEREILEFEELRNGLRPVLNVESIDDLPRALIQARIAAGLSQEELAAKLGLKPQQIQRYEATEYQSASLSRVAEVTHVLPLNLGQDVLPSSDEYSIPALIRRLKSVGLDEDFVVRRLLPRPVLHSVEPEDRSSSRELVFESAEALNRIYGWSPKILLGSQPLQLPFGPSATARFKLPARIRTGGLDAYVVYAHYLALLVLQATPDLEVKELPRDPSRVRAEILDQYQEITFTTALKYVWSLGVPVLPLNDPGAFHGACWRVRGRNVIILKQRTRSAARWLHDLLHEYFHAATDPDLEEHPVIEESEMAESRHSEEEINASRFAGEVVLAGKAEELTERCVERAAGQVRNLKRVVPGVAREAGVPVDALANYMAFRLSLQGINWWGAATNLQEDGTRMLQTPRELLLEHVDLTRLDPIDRDLLLRALEPLVLAFSGKIGSGKSTLSAQVALALGWKLASFGEFVRAIAKIQGLDDRREVLQDLGAALVEKDVEDFCRAFLAHFRWQAGEPLVVDGIRHAEVLETLRSLVAPLEVSLVFVDADDSIREERLRRSGDSVVLPLTELDSHSTEQQVGSRLAERAELRVSGTRPAPQVVREIVEWVHKRGPGESRAA